MTSHKIKDLLIRYQAGDCTDLEKSTVESWYLNYNEHEIDLSDEEIEVIKQRVFTAIPLTKPKVLPLYARIATVAAAIAIVGTIGLYYFSPSDSKLPDVAYANDIAPGSNKAILTLANGTKINLSDAKNGALVSQAGLQITKAADGTLIYEVTDSKNSLGSVSYNTISTPIGGQYQIKLPDGSSVWLNAASSLTYSTALNERGAERVVKLDGEAYFEVTKDKTKPFIVRTSREEVEVLGTHFNVSDYSNEPTVKTTLLEGSVRVAASKSKQVILKPNQQSSLIESNFQVKEVDPEQAVAWKNGEFMFDSEPLESIMNKVARWYDVEVVYLHPRLRAKTFGGTISKFTNVSEILSMLQITGGIHFKIEGRRITVTQ